MKNMKKTALILAAGLTMALCGCGSSGQEQATEAAETVTATTESTADSSGKKSSDFDLDPEEQVKSVADYSAVPLEISASYEVTDENKNNTLVYLLEQYGFDSTVEVTDRDLVEEDDYVNVDYTGYQDGEAFEGGSAKDQNIDISGNCAVGGSSYIDGFTAGLAGHKVGETVSYEVTFPDDYSSESLAGQTVTFEFKINKIIEPVTLENMTDEMVAEGIGASANLSTVDELSVTLDNMLEYSLESAKAQALQTYMVDNSSVEVPEDYALARVDDYQARYEKTYCTDGTSLEDYLQSKYSITVDEARETWLSNMKTQIAAEWIYQVVAKQLDLTVDEDEFETYVEYVVSNGSYEDKEDAYDTFGNGDQAYGETYLRNQYLQDLAAQEILKTAVVTYK